MICLISGRYPKVRQQRWESAGVQRPQRESLQTHLDNVPVVCELLQRGGVEAEGREGRRRQGVVVAGLLQRRQLVGGEARHGGEEEADAVHVLQGGFLAVRRPAAQRRPAEGGARSLAPATVRQKRFLFTPTSLASTRSSDGWMH